VTATLYHTPDFDIPEFSEPMPPDAVSLIEEYHEGLHKILISKQVRRNSYKPIGTVICQEGGDKRSRPGANPDEIAEYAMAVIQYEIEKNDDPGMYKITLVGPPGKGRFERSKHIDMSAGDGAPRSMAMINEGDLHEMKDAYIGELHSQIVAMIELVTTSHRQVVQENREMMKIVSEAARKNAEIERDRLRHQLEVKMHEDDVKFQESEAERSMDKFKQGIDVFKDTGAAEELMRAVARKIEGIKRGGQPVEMPPLPQGMDSKSESTSKKKSAKKKGAKKKAKKATIKRTGEGPKAQTDPSEDDEIMDEGQRISKMVNERPLVMAAEALKMGIDSNNQWSIIRKTLTPEQADALDDLFAATTDDDVIANAKRLYESPPLQNIMNLNDELDEQQRRFVAFILSRIPE
jgi:hypothetical protein